MDFDNMRFTKEHEWIAFDDSDLASIGITDFAASELGDIVFVELPEVGREVKIAEPVGTIEAVKTVADLNAPLSGIVKEINAQLADNPALINKSPFGDGWFLKLQMTARSELDELMTRDDYQQLVGED